MFFCILISVHCKLIYKKKKKKAFLKETKGTKAQQVSTPWLQRICQLAILERDRLETRTYYSFFFIGWTLQEIQVLGMEKKAELAGKKKETLFTPGWFMRLESQDYIQKSSSNFMF